VLHAFSHVIHGHHLPVIATIRPPPTPTQKIRITMRFGSGGTIVSRPPFGNGATSGDVRRLKLKLSSCCV